MSAARVEEIARRALLQGDADWCAAGPWRVAKRNEEYEQALIAAIAAALAAERQRAEAEHGNAASFWRLWQAAEARVAALAHFCRHRDSCDSYKVIDHTVPFSGYRSCTCGLTAALAPPA